MKHQLQSVALSEHMPATLRVSVVSAVASLHNLKRMQVQLNCRYCLT